MDAFDKAWSVVKGQSSDFDWFKPGWKRSIRGQRQLAAQMPQEPDWHGNMPRQTVDRWLDEDLEGDAMDNPNPAVNDALASIGEPNLLSRKRGADYFGNEIGGKLQTLNQRRRQGWDDLEGWDDLK